MLIAAEWGTGQVFLSILWFSLFVIWLWLIITIFSDIVRADDQSGMAKALWAILILVLPIFGALIYVMVNGVSMSTRPRGADAPDAAVDAAIRRAEGGDGLADELRALSLHRAAGDLTDAEYEAAKARLLAD